MLKIGKLLTGALALTAIAASITLSGCGDSKEVVRISHTQVETHPQHQALLAFKDYVESKMGDKFEVQIFPNATLGANEKVLELLEDGTSVQLLVVGTPNLELFDEYYSIFSLPFLFTSEKAYEKWISVPENIAKLGKNAQKDGYAPLTAYTAGTRNFYASFPIRTIDDLKGKKFRIPVSPTNVAMMETFGASATPMSFGEVYSALQQGVIDGAENNELALTDQKHGEVAKYFSYTGHQMCPDLLMVSNVFFDKLSSEERQLFTEAAAHSQKVEFDEWHRQIEAAKDAASKMGVEFINVDANAFREKVLPLHQQLLDKVPDLKPLYEEISAANHD